MYSRWLSHILIAGICLIPAAAWADPYGPSWKPELGLEEGLTFGGGNLLVSGITQQPGLTPPNASLYAGDTIYLQGYYRQAIGHTGVSLKAAGGVEFACQIPTCLDQFANYLASHSEPYQFGGLTGDVALEYAWDNGRVGVGRTVRASNLLFSTSQVYAFQDVYLRPAYGWFVEYEYDHVGLRYTHIIYHGYGSGASINGSNVGIYMHANYRDEDWYPGGKYFEEGMGMAQQGLAVMFHPQQWGF